MTLKITFPRLMAVSLLVLGTSFADEAVGVRPWPNYQVFLWMGGEGQKEASNPVLHERLKELGVTAVSVSPGSDTSMWRDAGIGFYVENIVREGLCLKFRSNVTKWGDFVGEWMKTRDPGALVRDYCLDDPAWQEAMSKQVRDAATRHATELPLMYDLRDELSTTISANPFDYDFSPMALAAFRAWLKTRYADLDALNAQWGTRFASWEEVVPLTTDAIKHQMATGEAVPEGGVDWQAVKRVVFDPAKAMAEPEKWNLAPWADHRTFMDVSLARVLETFRQASHGVDLATPVGIEGTQMPSAFGGYDLWRMAQVLDWVEPYDICNSREIFGSFMKGKPILCTVFEKETRAAQRRLWHLLLEGDKGCIVWWSEDVIDWSNPELPLTAKGKALAPVFHQLTSPLARLFMLAERERDPIVIHYSQPSIQVAWLLESFADGQTWVRRFSSYESDHNQHALVRNGWLKALQDLGFSPEFVAGESLAKGDLQAPGDKTRMLVMPQSWAASEAELKAARAFGRRDNRLVIRDGPAGLFDEHGTLRTKADWPRGEFDGVATTDQVLVAGTVAGVEETRTWQNSFASYCADRLKGDFDGSGLEELREMLAARGTRPWVQVPLEARVRVHRFKVGKGARLLGFERNIEYKMREELAQVGGNEALEQPTTFQASWYEPSFVVNLRTGERLGRTNRISVDLDPWEPSLFALFPEEPSFDDLIAELTAIAEAEAMAGKK